MSSRSIGYLFLTAGFLAGAYVVVAQVDSVNWLYYGGCLVLMFVGMFFVRLAKSAEATASEKHDQDLDALESSIGRLIEKVAVYTTIEDDEELLELHGRIDRELMADFDEFVQARESMIPRLGMQSYANIMSPFALGERLMNRAWSASADGYVDEVRRCVRDSLGELEHVRELLRVARD